jgi:Cu+-exporting ATPase
MQYTSAVRHSAALVALLVAIASIAVVGTGCSSSGAGGSGGTAAGTQHLDVDISSGTYVPAELTATAGKPIEITFSQGRSCARSLVFPTLGLKADTTNGPQTLQLGVLAAGDYPWDCTMNMYHGVLHVK